MRPPGWGQGLRQMSTRRQSRTEGQLRSVPGHTHPITEASPGTHQQTERPRSTKTVRAAPGARDGRDPQETAVRPGQRSRRAARGEQSSREKHPSSAAPGQVQTSGSLASDFQTLPEIRGLGQKSRPDFMARPRGQTVQVCLSRRRLRAAAEQRAEERGPPGGPQPPSAAPSPSGPRGETQLLRHVRVHGPDATGLCCWPRSRSQ